VGHGSSGCAPLIEPSLTGSSSWSSFLDRETDYQRNDNPPERAHVGGLADQAWDVATTVDRLETTKPDQGIASAVFIVEPVSVVLARRRQAECPVRSAAHDVCIGIILTVVFPATFSAYFKSPAFAECPVPTTGAHQFPSMRRFRQTADPRSTRVHVGSVAGLIRRIQRSVVDV